MNTDFYYLRNLRNLRGNGLVTQISQMTQINFSVCICVICGNGLVPQMPQMNTDFYYLRNLRNLRGCGLVTQISQMTQINLSVCICVICGKRTIKTISVCIRGICGTKKVGQNNHPPRIVTQRRKGEMSQQQHHSTAKIELI